MTELDLQKFTATLLRLNAAPGVIWFHPANGENRSPRTGAKLKAMGVRKGVADMVIVLPRGIACFLELKTPKGNMSPEQRAFRADCERAGAQYELARTSGEVEQILRAWGAIGKPVKPVARAA